MSLRDAVLHLGFILPPCTHTMKRWHKAWGWKLSLRAYQWLFASAVTAKNSSKPELRWKGALSRRQRERSQGIRLWVILSLGDSCLFSTEVGRKEYCPIPKRQWKPTDTLQQKAVCPKFHVLPKIPPAPPKIAVFSAMSMCEKYRYTGTYAGK